MRDNPVASVSSYPKHTWLAAGALVLVALSGCAKPQVAHPEVSHADQLWQRAVFLADRGDDFGAEQYFVAARGAGYPEQRVVRELVQVCAAAGRLEQAIIHARSYLDRNPEDWTLRHVLASIQFAKGDALAARFELGQVLEQQPAHAESVYLLALVMRDGHADFAEAGKHLSRYLELAPEGPHAIEARAWLRRAASYPVSTTVMRP
ncbi:MAG: hypothetical protein RLZZ450_6429 [Pseudomonadota bacterium]|jgi:tetratricopeptide (TPR) repeat protein